jgi:hypothetical protein
MKKVLVIVVCACVLLFTAQAMGQSLPTDGGRIIFVDPTLSADITNGTYDRIRRSPGGSDGNAYCTIKKALQAMSSGDDIFIRGGTYREGNIALPQHGNGTANNWSSLQSYPGEWAILDGQFSTSIVLGSSVSWSHQYWRIERLEIKNAGANNSAAGILLMQGPVILRFLYIHDNRVSKPDNNPSGLLIYQPRDCIVQFNVFENNGAPYGLNGANIAFFSDYLHEEIFPSQYPYRPSEHGTRRNTVRYNLFLGSPVGFKNKARQYFTARNPVTQYLVNTYKNFGDNIHHNIFIGQTEHAIELGQDFIQIHHNIVEDTEVAIVFQGSTYDPLYRATAYSNTVIDASVSSLVWMAHPYLGKSFPKEVYGYSYNNLVVNGTAGEFWASPENTGILSINHKLYSSNNRVPR